MSNKKDDAYLFVVEWFDPMPQLKRQYLMKYFHEQHMVEMIDLKSKKLFLKKSVCPPEVTKEEFVVGGKVLLYSRLLDIVDYGDLKTREKLHEQVEKFIVVMTPDLYAKWGSILSTLNKSFHLLNISTAYVDQRKADDICDLLTLSAKNSTLFSDGICLVALMSGIDGFRSVKELSIDLGFFCSTTMEHSEILHELLLHPRRSNTATFDSCTCALVKPHAVKRRLVGPIMEHIISQGYEISAVSMIHFDRTEAAEFLEVYKDVVPEYSDHCKQFCSGPSVAFEVRAEEAVHIFRQTAGPWDSEMAKELRPDTIRGQYGEDKVRNALHCTDLPTDGVSECKYCFELVAPM